MFSKGISSKKRALKQFFSVFSRAFDTATRASGHSLLPLPSPSRGPHPSPQITRDQVQALPVGSSASVLQTPACEALVWAAQECERRQAVRSTNTRERRAAGVQQSCVCSDDRCEPHQLSGRVWLHQGLGPWGCLD